MRPALIWRGVGSAAAILAMTIGLGPAPAAANERFMLHLTVKAADRETAGFDAPEVVYFVSREERVVRQEDVDHTVTPRHKERQGLFIYGEHPNDAIGDIRYEGDFVHINIYSPSYVVTNPLLLRVQLQEQHVGTPIRRTIQLDHPKNLAKLYRDEAIHILRRGQLGRTDLIQAEEAARSAMQYDPSLRHMELLLRVVRRGLAEGGRALTFAPASISDMRAIDGFEAMAVEDQWNAMLVLLEVLAGVQEPQQSYGRVGTVEEAAILLGDELLKAGDDVFPAKADLPLLKVFRTLSYLHQRNGDCLMLVDNAKRALAIADDVDMAWNAQRRFLGEWSGCLSRVAGLDEAGPTDAAFSDAIGDPFLVALWSEFADSLTPYQSRLRFSTAQEDRDLLKLHVFALRVQEEGQQ